MFPFTVRLAVVVAVARWLAIGRIVSLQLVLKLTHILEDTSGGVSHPPFTQVVFIIGVLLALLLSYVHVVLPACHLGISEIGDG